MRPLRRTGFIAFDAFSTANRLPPSGQARGQAFAGKRHAQAMRRPDIPNATVATATSAQAAMKRNTARG